MLQQEYCAISEMSIVLTLRSKRFSNIFLCIINALWRCKFHSAVVVDPLLSKVLRPHQREVRMYYLVCYRVCVIGTSVSFIQ